MAADFPRGSDAPVSAPIDTDSAGKGGPLAINSVMRVICPSIDSAGTGFLHRSGKIITAEHVVHGASEIMVLPVSGNPIKAALTASDSELDLALLTPESPIGATALPISSRTDFLIGAPVTTWGFPGGYGGRAPLLSVGYLSGLETRATAAGKFVGQWIVNAAFNKGNSGGPLLDMETGEIIGVVASKLAPITPSTKSALDALANQSSGLIYQGTRPDGTKITASEGQIIAQVLNELRGQVQLVIGKAALVGDLRSFLKDHAIEP